MYAAARSIGHRRKLSILSAKWFPGQAERARSSRRPAAEWTSPGARASRPTGLCGQPQRHSGTKEDLGPERATRHRACWPLSPGQITRGRHSNRLDCPSSGKRGGVRQGLGQGRVRGGTDSTRKERAGRKAGKAGAARPAGNGQSERQIRQRPTGLAGRLAGPSAGRTDVQLCSATAGKKWTAGRGTAARIGPARLIGGTFPISSSTAEPSAAVVPSVVPTVATRAASCGRGTPRPLIHLPALLPSPSRERF